nr:COG1361 S-layer family protein [Nanoarchaeota archaeon]
MKNKMKNKYLFVSLILVILIGLFSGSVLADVDDKKDITLSLVNQDPDPAITGDVVELRIGVENQGGVAAENLVLEVIPDYPFEEISGEELVQDVGTIRAYQSGEDIKIVKFKLRVNKDATEGQYEIKVWEYEEGKREIFRTERTFSIDVQSRESAEIIYIDKVQLIPGKQTPMTFTINNVGSAPLRDLTFSWENENDIVLPVGSDNTKYIKYLDIGESVELAYDVIADTNADPGLYKLDLHLTYEDPATGNQTTIITQAGVYVGGETDFDVAFSESSAGSTSFTIANIGSNPAYSVSVIIPRQDGWRVSGSNTVIIGNLDKGDYTVASFALQSGGSATTRTFDKDPRTMTEEERAEFIKQRQAEDSPNTVKVQIDYTDTMGRRDTIEKEVQVSVQTSAVTTEDGQTTMPGARGFQRNQPSFFSQYKWYIIGLVILIIAFFVHRKYKKEKLANPKFKFKDLFKKKKK